MTPCSVAVGYRPFGGPSASIFRKPVKGSNALESAPPLKHQMSHII